MLAIRRILFPTDFSNHCQPAFELACSLARDYCAELIICHVAELPMLVPVEGLLVPTPIQEAESLRPQLEAIHPVDPNVAVRHQLLEGVPAEEILTAAADLHIDLIVMGTHGRTGFSRVLFGSVTEEVLRKAPCPVLTVKTPFPINPTEATTASKDKVLAASR